MPRKPKAKTLWENMVRLLRMRLLIPLLRSPHPPEYKARGVAVGLAWAMTPLIGIQMWLVFMTWVFCRKVLKWHFSLVLGCAWTWITNVVTMIPTYYLFYVTGQIMRGRFDSISGYASLQGTLHESFMQNLTFVEKWTHFFKLLLQDWGISMAVGCLPWMVLSAVAGYYLTMRFEEKRAQRRAQKEAARLLAGQGKIVS